MLYLGWERDDFTGGERLIKVMKPMNIPQLLGAILNAFVEIVGNMKVQRALEYRMLHLLLRIEKQMADLITVTSELEQDDAAVLTALNALAQEIKDLQATQADPALVARLEKVHSDFVAALQPTTPVTPVAATAKTTQSNRPKVV